MLGLFCKIFALFPPCLKFVFHCHQRKVDSQASSKLFDCGLIRPNVLMMENYADQVMAVGYGSEVNKCHTIKFSHCKTRKINNGRINSKGFT